MSGGVEDASMKSFSEGTLRDRDHDRSIPPCVPIFRKPTSRYAMAVSFIYAACVRVTKTRCLRPSPESTMPRAICGFMRSVREPNVERLRKVSVLPQAGQGIVAAVPATDGFDIAGSAIYLIGRGRELRVCDHRDTSVRRHRAWWRIDELRSSPRRANAALLNRRSATCWRSTSRCCGSPASWVSAWAAIPTTLPASPLHAGPCADRRGRARGPRLKGTNTLSSADARIRHDLFVCSTLCLSGRHFSAVQYK